ncbi:YjcQ family protein [Limosilactobacillus alvi]|uniref:YjcQ family protein n=1 Tax=Limosilactobacillus alvi TaxID=990412 RepID=UPI003084182C
MFHLAKNDYFVVMYRLMMYLYNCLKNDQQVDLSKITSSYLGINERYFQYILTNLVNDGYLMADSTYEDMNGLHVMESIMISPKGIAYLHENSTIAKVKSSVKGLSDIIGNVTPL